MFKRLISTSIIGILIASMCVGCAQIEEQEQYKEEMAQGTRDRDADEYQEQLDKKESEDNSDDETSSMSDEGLQQNVEECELSDEEYNAMMEELNEIDGNSPVYPFNENSKCTGTYNWYQYTLNSDIYFAYNSEYAMSIQNIRRVKEYDYNFLVIEYTSYNNTRPYNGLPHTESNFLNSRTFQNKKEIGLDAPDKIRKEIVQKYTAIREVPEGGYLEKCHELIYIEDMNKPVYIPLGLIYHPIQQSNGLENEFTIHTYHVLSINPRTLKHKIIPLSKAEKHIADWYMEELIRGNNDILGIVDENGNIIR